MKKNWNEINTHKQYESAKRHMRQGRIASFFISFCGVLVVAICLLINNFPLSIEEQPNIPLFPDDAINIDNNPATAEDVQGNTSAADAQSSADDAAWYLILVNRWNPIPDNYEIELTALANGQLVDKRIYPALQDMFNDARSHGVYPLVVSGYRTTKTQQRLLNEKIAEYRSAGCSAAEARTKAERWVAVPGTSEHQIGIAVDINADGIHSAGYEVYDWLEQNAHKYGFICRYSADKTEITGVLGEAWHYRYVGIKAATEIHNQSICLEEYLNRID